LGLGVNVVRAGATTAAAAFLAAGFAAAFLAAAVVAAPFFGGGAAFLTAGAVFRAGVAFLAGAAFFAVDPTAFLAADGAGFFAGEATFLVAVAAFFTTGAAFFFVRAGRFVAVAATFDAELLFPVRDEAAEPERDAGTLLTWAPFLAGVIVPSFGPREVAGFPDDDLVRGAGDDTGRRQHGQQHPGRPPRR